MDRLLPYNIGRIRKFTKRGDETYLTLNWAYRIEDLPDSIHRTFVQWTSGLFASHTEPEAKREKFGENSRDRETERQRKKKERKSVCVSERETDIRAHSDTTHIHAHAHTHTLGVFVVILGEQHDEHAPFPQTCHCCMLPTAAAAATVEMYPNLKGYLHKILVPSKHTDVMPSNLLRYAHEQRERRREDGEGGQW